MSETIEPLWTAKELAAFLGYKESTVSRMVALEPDRLPPRVAAMRLHRWVPSVCREWTLKHTHQAPTKTTGRPRRVPA